MQLHKERAGLEITGMAIRPLVASTAGTTVESKISVKVPSCEKCLVEGYVRLSEWTYTYACVLTEP